MTPISQTLTALIEPARLRRRDDISRLPEPRSALMLGAVVLTALIAATLAPTELALTCAAAALFLPALTWIDLDAHRLPDALTRPALIATGVASIITALITEAYPSLIRATLGAALVALLMLSLGLAIPGGPGLGDVKTAPILGLPLAWHSWTMLLTWIAIAFLVNAATALGLQAATRTRGSTHLPFGPAMTFAWFTTLALMKS